MNAKQPARRPSTDPDQLTQAVFGGERLLTTREVAAIFRTSEKTIREWIGRGELMATRFGKAWYISDTALRASKELKEEQARAEMIQRRRQAALAAELASKREREREMRWQLTQCIECDKEQVFTSLYARDDGRVLCDACKPGDQLSREALERRASVQVQERNRRVQEAADEEADFYGEEPRQVYRPWFVYHCPRCGYPQPLSLNQLERRDFYPWCDHCEPDGVFGGIVARGEMDPLVVSRLAGIEADARNRSQNEDPNGPGDWEVCLCTACGERRAVSDTESRMAGCAVCRLCHAKGTYEVQIPLRLRLMTDALSRRALDHGVRLVAGYCPQGHVDALLEWPRAGGPAEPVLAVCEAIPDEQRREQVESFISRYGLGKRAASELRGWASPLDLEDLPF